MDISYCGDKTGFPRPGHILYTSCIKNINIQKTLYLTHIAYIIDTSVMSKMMPVGMKAVFYCSCEHVMHKKF